MKHLRVFRIILAALFFAASLAYLCLGGRAHAMTAMAARSQIILSAIAFSGPATICWVVFTILFGRIYCSTVCPVGYISDMILTLRRRMKRYNKPFSYRKKRLWSVHILIVYIICLTIGILAIPFIIEPWNIFRNIVSTFHPSVEEQTWITIGLGAGTGIVCGVFSLVALAVYSLLYGRRFCTEVCPLGTMMGFIDNYTLFHMEINPDKCISCGKCEDICRSECIKISERLVDNSKCVRCFDCTAVCPNDAIRYQIDRNKPMTPLLRKREESTI